MENIFFHIEILLGSLLVKSNVVLLEIVTKTRYRSVFKGRKSDIKTKFPSERKKNKHRLLYSDVYS